MMVCLVNFFEGHGDDERIRQHLCACFHLLSKAYHSALDSDDNASETSKRSELVLQILPISLLASLDGAPVILSAKEVQALAMEIYDRIPSVRTYERQVHAVELAPMLPKRVNFQLTPSTPSDLLLEGSVLHLAYALSHDGEWMSIHWIDGSAHLRESLAVSLRARSFSSVVAAVWAQTAGILEERAVTWRVFIVRCGVHRDRVEHGKTQDVLEDAEREVWKEIVSKNSRRKQVLHVTILSTIFEDTATLQFHPGSADVAKATNDLKVTMTTTTPVAGFLTPGSTPQTNIANVTTSPGNATTPAQNAAPTTPTPTPTDTREAIAAILENDPDAHLIDTSDESWGMLLSSTIRTLGRPDGGDAKVMALASGLLIQRGPLPIGRGTARTSDKMSSSSEVRNGHLQTLRVDIHADLRIRPLPATAANGGNGANGANVVVDEGQQRQGEQTLREVLRMYRNLAVIGRSKMGGEVQYMPWHVYSAFKGVEALDGFLGMEDVGRRGG